MPMTRVFLKASESNLKLCLRILQWFNEISGLKINIKKTKVIRIGCIRESDRRYCKENNLDWVSKFDALGITYDVLDMQNLTEINIEGKIPQMMHLIQSWSRRNITPLGRITVLKSLILSKITHILISLPAPSEDTFKKIEKMCIDFIWKGGRHEVSKSTLYRDIKSGGLNMVNIRDFESSLKLTWIRRLISGTPDWTEFAEQYCINHLYQTDEIYHSKLLIKVKNKFWHSVIKAYSVWFKK